MAKIAGQSTFDCEQKTSLLMLFYRRIISTDPAVVRESDQGFTVNLYLEKVLVVIHNLTDNLLLEFLDPDPNLRILLLLFLILLLLLDFL